jgi:hypothetical protein
MVQELLTIDTGNAIAHCVAFDRATKVLAVGCSNAEIKAITKKLICQQPSISTINHTPLLESISRGKDK